MYKKDNSFYFNSDAIFDIIGSNYNQEDAFERFPINLAHGLNSGKWPGFHMTLPAAAINSVYVPNNTAVIGCFFGSIIRFTSTLVDCTFAVVPGQQITSPDAAVWNNFGLSLSTPAPTSGAIFTGGVLSTDAYAMCIDPVYNLFFIPAGYSLTFTGVVTAEVIDTGNFVISKSTSGTYGGLATFYLSNTGPIAKWDGSYRFGQVFAADLSNIAAVGSSNNRPSYFPVYVDPATRFCDLSPCPASNGGANVNLGTHLYSVLLPCANIAGDGKNFVNSASAHFFGKRFVPLNSGTNSIPYIALNTL